MSEAYFLAPSVMVTDGLLIWSQPMPITPFDWFVAGVLLLVFVPLLIHMAWVLTTDYGPDLGG